MAALHAHGPTLGSAHGRAAAWWSVLTPTAICTFTTPPPATFLFQTRLPASVQGFPITYAVDGRQYVAVPVGGNRSNAIYVFALPVEAGGR